MRVARLSNLRLSQKAEMHPYTTITIVKGNIFQTLESFLVVDAKTFLL
jgi:hypothetical protein